MVKILRLGSIVDDGDTRSFGSCCQKLPPSPSPHNEDEAVVVRVKVRWLHNGEASRATKAVIEMDRAQSKRHLL